MSCKDFDGPCDLKFQGETLDAIAEKVRDHGNTMAREGDNDHANALEKMDEIINDPDKKVSWIKKKQREFDALPEVD